MGLVGPPRCCLLLSSCCRLSTLPPIIAICAGVYCCVVSSPSSSLYRFALPSITAPAGPRLSAAAVALSVLVPAAICQTPGLAALCLFDALAAGLLLVLPLAHVIH
eukprot:GHRR01008066.1.p2 GENE.GHRR01008066.1~~GHRR01008066.1.p2  ORF type:complete len:106 (-),score=21.74 GHRR01008066.1:572-889(-)